MAEAWEMRTNFRKPGSQGTLFQVGDKDSLLNPQQRWPKGYTPERQREVHEATQTLPISYPQHMEESHEPGEYHEMDSYRDKVRQIISRSTVPVEDLKGLREIHGEPGEGHEGTYWFDRRTIGVDVTRREGDQTLIHELGHHHDSMNDVSRPLSGDVARIHAERNVPDWRKGQGVSGTDVSMEYSRVHPGVMEAVADNYLVKHYRSPGKIGNQKTLSRGAYEQNFTGDRLDQQYPGYTDVRPSAKPGIPRGPLGPQWDGTRQEHLPGMDRHWEQREKEKQWFQRKDVSGPPPHTQTRREDIAMSRGLFG